MPSLLEPACWLSMALFYSMGWRISEVTTQLTSPPALHLGSSSAYPLFPRTGSESYIPLPLGKGKAGGRLSSGNITGEKYLLGTAYSQTGREVFSFGKPSAKNLTFWIRNWHISRLPCLRADIGNDCGPSGAVRGSPLS